MNHEIKYYTNGNKQYELYCNDLGELHNTKGPAYVSYNKSGKIIYKEYYLNNNEIHVKTDEEFVKYIKRLNIS